MSGIRLGNISGSHGVRGWVRVYSFTDPAEAILGYSPWILRKDDREKQYTVAGGRSNGKWLIARLDGIGTRDLADELLGCEIYVARETLPTPEEGSYYWFQLVGLKVMNKSGAVFGRIDHLLETGANDVIVVRPTDDGIDGKERLIPYVEKEVVLEVDRAAGVMVVDWEIDY